MNTGFESKGFVSKVFVDNGNDYELKTDDNLESKLIVQNEIEVLNETIRKLKVLYKTRKVECDDFVFPKNIIKAVMVPVTNICIYSFLSELLLRVPNMLAGDLLLKFIFLVPSVFFIAAYLVDELASLYYHNEKCKEVLGLEKSIEYLNKQVDIKKDNLVSLEKSSEEVSVYESNNIDIEATYDYVSSLVDLYFELGYNLKKYNDLLEKGLLDSEFANIYNAEGKELARDFVVEENKKMQLKK